MIAGLCDSCVHQKLIRSGRGSVFSMCLRSKTDKRFPKYPRIPVEHCPGYESARSDTGATDRKGRDGGDMPDRGSH